MFALTVNINENCKMVEFWLTTEENNDETVRASLKSQFKDWKSKHYLPVVYCSGTADLEQCMSGIMRNNNAHTLQPEELAQAV